MRGQKEDIPLVGTFHSKFYDDFVQYFHSDHIARAGVNLVIKFFQKCDSVWTVSDATVETLREYGYQGPITVINNGTDLAAPETQAEVDDAKQQAEALCSLRPDQPLFVFVGQH
ncbi:MAG: glycosyltransferase, partial [Christensenellales bacterium]